MQEDLDERERRLQKKEQRFAEVMNAQRDALIQDRNTRIDMMRETGKADMQTWVEGDQYVGVAMPSGSSKSIVSSRCSKSSFSGFDSSTVPYHTLSTGPFSFERL